MPVRPCLDCGMLTQATRCPTHTKARKGIRNREAKTARAAVAAHPWCSKCGKTADLTMDHIIPIAKGGRATPGNVAVLCRSCNSKKRAR